MNDANTYIIKGGVEGKERLNVLANVLSRYTRQLIGASGGVEGRHFLDVGCGGGHVSLMVAGMIGETGSVYGIDFDAEIVALAEKDAADRNIGNVRFAVQSAYELGIVDTFDIAYSRFLLSHLTAPQLVLHKMVASLKAGGRLIVEDIDFTGHFCHPEHWSFSAYVDLFTRAARNNGQDANIGQRLFRMVREAGLRNVGFDVIQPAHHTGEGKWMAYYTMDKIRQAVLQQQLATEHKIREILNGIRAFTEQEDTIISLPRIFRVWGYK